MSTPGRSFGTRSGRLASPSPAEQSARKPKVSTKKSTKKGQGQVESLTALSSVLIDESAFPSLTDAGVSTSAASEASVAALAMLLQKQQQELIALRAEKAGLAAAPPNVDGLSRVRWSDLPVFDGSPSAPTGTLIKWLNTLRSLSAYHQLTEAAAVRLAVSRLTDTAFTWWQSLERGGRTAAITTIASLTSELETRFQPITAERTAREQLDVLKQGGRSVLAYIAEFQRLMALLPTMDEGTAVYKFVSSSSPAIATRLREENVQTLSAAYAKAALLDAAASSAASASAPPARPAAAAFQMDSYSSADSRMDRLEATLHAIAAAQGIGARTQTQHGYQQDRGAPRSRFAGRSGGRGGGPSGPQRPPSVPGVPAAVVEQRKAANQCYRCGDAEHTRFDCPNAISSSGSSF